MAGADGQTNAPCVDHLLERKSARAGDTQVAAVMADFLRPAVFILGARFAEHVSLNWKRQDQLSWKVGCDVSQAPIGHDN